MSSIADMSVSDFLIVDMYVLNVHYRPTLYALILL